MKRTYAFNIFISPHCTTKNIYLFIRKPGDVNVFNLPYYLKISQFISMTSGT